MFAFAAAVLLSSPSRQAGAFEHRAAPSESHRGEGGDGGGAARGHSPPRALLAWTQNITAATSQVGQGPGL